MNRSLDSILEDVDSDKVTRKKVGPRQLHAMHICMRSSFLFVQTRKGVPVSPQSCSNLVCDTLAVSLTQEGVKQLLLALDSDVMLAKLDAATTQIVNNKIPGELDS